jgi:hypothetical protein
MLGNEEAGDQVSEQELEVTETELEESADVTAEAGDESEVESSAPESDDAGSDFDAEADSPLPPPRQTLTPLRSSRPSCAARKVTGTSSTPTPVTKTA